MLRQFRPLVLFAASVLLLAAPSAARAENAVSFSGSNLYFYDTATPDVYSARPVTGLPAMILQGGDIRPANGELYLLYTLDTGGGAADTRGELWKVVLATGVASQVGIISSALPDNVSYGFEFSAADRIRLVGDDESNRRINPDTAAMVNDTGLSLAGDVVAVAYDRTSTAGGPSTAFVIDYVNDTLLRLGGVDGNPSANGGELTSIGALGQNLGNLTSFDISPTTGIAYAVNHFPGFPPFTPPASTVYTVNLTTGAATMVRVLPFSGATGVHPLAASTIGVQAGAVTATEAAGTATVTVARVGATNTSATVDFTTAAGTATAGTDFTPVSGTLTFAVGETTKTIQVPITQDSAVDNGETFTVTLSRVVGATAASALTTTVTIGDEDVADTTKPSVLLPALTARTFASLVRFGLPAPFSVSEAARTTATLRLGTKVVGAAPAVTTNRAAITRVKAALTPTGRNAVRSALAASRTGRVVLALTLTTKDTAGNAKLSVARVVVRR